MKRARASHREPAAQPFHVRRSVRDRQGDYLWLEQDLELRKPFGGAGGRGFLLVMGAAWMLEFIHLPAGRMSFSRDGRWLHSPGRRFAVFYAPFSITESRVQARRLNWVGVAGTGTLPGELEAPGALLFPLRASRFPRDAREALRMLAARRDAVEIGVTAQPTDLAARAKTLIEREYGSAPPVSAVAARLGVSHAHLSRIFKAAWRMTPLEYVHRLRLNDAYKLLSKGVRIVDVSLDVGYNDLSRFYKQFRKHTRVPPGTCRSDYIKKRQDPGHSLP